MWNIFYFTTPPFPKWKYKRITVWHIYLHIQSTSNILIRFGERIFIRTLQERGIPASAYPQLSHRLGLDVNFVAAFLQLFYSFSTAFLQLFYTFSTAFLQLFYRKMGSDLAWGWVCGFGGVNFDLSHTVRHESFALCSMERASWWRRWI